MTVTSIGATVHVTWTCCGEPVYACDDDTTIRLSNDPAAADPQPTLNVLIAPPPSENPPLAVPTELAVQTTAPPPKAPSGVGIAG